MENEGIMAWHRAGALAGWEDVGAEQGLQQGMLSLGSGPSRGQEEERDLGVILGRWLLCSMVSGNVTSLR